MRTWIRNYRKSARKLTLGNILNFFIAKIRKRDTETDKIAEWREEQVRLKSPECLEQGYCKICYCEFEDGLLYQEKACEGGCYPNWEESKKLVNAV